MVIVYSISRELIQARIQTLLMQWKYDIPFGNNQGFENLKQTKLGLGLEQKYSKT